MVKAILLAQIPAILRDSFAMQLYTKRVSRAALSFLLFSPHAHIDLWRRVARKASRRNSRGYDIYLGRTSFGHIRAAAAAAVHG